MVRSDHGDTSEGGRTPSLPHRGTSRSEGLGCADGAQTEMATRVPGWGKRTLHPPARWFGNVFAPIKTVNDTIGGPLAGTALMQEFARQMERKQGRPTSPFPDPGAGHTDVDFRWKRGSGQSSRESHKPQASQAC